jgi:membrane protease YdiL (CAAX protease family)
VPDLDNSDLMQIADEPVPEPALSPAPAALHRTWPTWIEILLCSGYPTQLLVGQMLVLAGFPPQLSDGRLSGTFVFALSLVDSALLISLIVFLLVRRGERPLAVLFGGRAVGREAAIGAWSLPFVLAMVMVLTIGIRRVLPSLHNVPDNPLEGLAGSGANLWLFLIVVIVAGGVREELQRAFLLHRFRGDLGQPWMGLLITSISFGMGHTLQGLDAAIITGVLGATWGAIYLKRDSAIASIVSHSLFNSAELLRVVTG